MVEIRRDTDALLYADSSLESRRLYGRFSNLAQKIAESEQPWQNAEAEEQEPHPRPLKMGFDVAIKTEQSFVVRRDHGGRVVVGGVRYGQVETPDADAASMAKGGKKTKKKKKGQKLKKKKK